MISRAPATISRMITAAGLRSVTNPTLCPASNPIDSISPVASAVGGDPANRCNGTRSPPNIDSPITGSSTRCSEPRASSFNHSSTNAVRSVRCGAWGNRVRIEWSAPCLLRSPPIPSVYRWDALLLRAWPKSGCRVRRPQRPALKRPPNRAHRLCRRRRIPARATPHHDARH